MIEIDNQTHNVEKFWITDNKANLSMAYHENEDLVFFNNQVSPTTVKLYVSDGTYESTTLLKEVLVDADETILNSFFLNDGDESYFVCNTYLRSEPAESFSHVYKLTANTVTALGTYKDLKPYPRQIYIKNGILYGYNKKTRDVVEAKSSTSILHSVDFVTFEGEYKGNMLFTVPSPASTLGDSLVALFQTDGTSAGTRMIADKVDAFFTKEKAITVHKGLLYFIKRDDEYGAELYRYDGQNVSMEEDAIPGTAGLQRVQFHVYEDELYFAAQQSDSPEKLHVFKISENAGSIHLSTYADINANGEKDVEEPYISNSQFLLNGGSLNVYSSQETTAINLQYGSHTITPLAQAGWIYASGKQPITVNLPEDNGKSFSFGLIPAEINTKVDATLMSDATRCGFPTPYTLHYSNSGSTKASGTIKLVPEAKFTFDSATPAPHTISGDTLTWQLNDLEIGKKGKIFLNFTMPGVEQMGDTLVSKLFTEFRNAENKTLGADTTTLQQILTCSYDPNDIQVTPAGEGKKHLTLKKKKLEYLIRFQNMGTDKAFNIVVTNELQQELDLSTFEVIGSSHDMYTVVKENLVSFHFDNIHLPDDKTDEPGSHGYILYTIKPKAGLPDSSVINNQAFIYFDYNPAIETNIVYNTLVDRLPAKAVLAVEDALGEATPIVFPNPAADKLNISWPAGSSPYTLYSLSNSRGQLVLQAKFKSGSVHQLDVRMLPAGLYFLRTTRQEGTFVRKILIQ